MEEKEQLCGIKIGQSIYGIPILRVQEIVMPHQLTPIPLAQKYIDGLINLRGQIVLSLNMREIMGIEEEYPSKYMNVIIKGKDSIYSLKIDEIVDIIDVDDNCFEKTPKIINDKIGNFIKGIYKLKEKIVILLDLDKVLKISV